MAGGQHPGSPPTDMARLGLVWLHDGVWQDRRIFPAGWTGNV
jgi:CubicO group peptidase (beta-lactamase class C family)